MMTQTSNKTKYKQTEIGEIPEDWNVATVESLSEWIVSGGTPSRKHREYYIDGSIPWIKTQELNDAYIYDSEEKISEEALTKSSAKVVPQGTITIAMYGATVGKLGILGIDASTNQACCNVVVNKELISNLFLFYSLLYRKSDLINLSSGAAQQNLNVGVIKNFKIAFPNLLEQRQIASILSSLDDKIELNRRMNKTLEEIGKALFKRWFVDFEFPNENGEPYKSSGGEMVDSELGEMPKGWNAVSLIEMFDFLEGPGIRNWQYSESGTRFINIRLINNGDIDIALSNFINQKDVDTKYQHFLLSEGDMVVSTSGTLGRSAIVRKSHLPLLLNTSVIRFRPQDQTSYPFMYQYLRSEEFLSEQIRLSAGSVQANFGPTHLKKMSILKPSQETLQQFNQLCGILHQKVIGNMDEIERLTTTRDSLLPRLMSGRIRV